jgi:hypothetical protein
MIPACAGLANDENRWSSVTETNEIARVIDRLLRARVPEDARRWLAGATQEIASGVDDLRFTSLLSLASRPTPRAALEPNADEREACSEALVGWNPERWQLLETVRAALILARPDLQQPGCIAALEDAFLCADAGELCALYRALPLLPDPARFATRMGEACRSNMAPVFEAAAFDNPFPSRHFDDIAWRQLVIKAVFIEAPLWRVFELDARLDPELARMTLDFIDERRSAGRSVQPQAWLCLGEHADERGIESIAQELRGQDATGRGAAAFALARTGEVARLSDLLPAERDEETRDALARVRDGQHDQASFAAWIESRART